MFGWLIAATARASRSNRARASGSSASVRGQHFDGDVAAEPRVVGLVDFAHAAGADGRNDFVRAEARADPAVMRPRADYIARYAAKSLIAIGSGGATAASTTSRTRRTVTGSNRSIRA